MAKDAKKKVSRIKTKKKIWFKVVAPKLFGNKEIGESYLPNVEKALGRTMQVNLRNLTGNVKDQNSYVSFSIDKAEGSTLRTETIGFWLTPQHVKRAVRKNTARMDDYFVLKTKDGKTLIAKTLMISRARLQRSLKSSLRKQLGEALKAEVAKNTLDGVVSLIIGYKLQAGIKKKLGKLTPLKEVAIRSLQLKKTSGRKTLTTEEFTETVEAAGEEPSEDFAEESAEMSEESEDAIEESTEESEDVEDSEDEDLQSEDEESEDDEELNK